MTDIMKLDIAQNGRQLREALTSLLARQSAVHVDDVMQTILAVAGGEGENTTDGSGPAAPLSEPAKGQSVRDIHVTQREREVISYIGSGMSNNEIAKEMHVATHTVKTHVRNIMMKLGVRSRLQIAARIYREHWIPAMSA
jgi:DNA-binding NarL/FixJ family response regulator